MLLTALYKSAFFFLSQSPQTPLYKYINDFFQYIYHNSQYINDFSNISITTHNISTIFPIYRLVDNIRHYLTPITHSIS
ncbi:hypothetical protein CON89_05895 [Bacillus toyonensis]|nr:hypothetical protein CON89_05895 [Bacillus toyonensis]PEN39435.1 hypothetical protein CN541_12070 [Bacillus toyonensis]